MRLRLLDIREDEWKAAGPALTLAALAVGALTLATIAADALFVSTFDVGRLSGFYVVTAAARVAALLAYGAYARSGLSSSSRARAGLIVITAALALVSGVSAGAAPAPLLYLLCAALHTLPALLPLVAMSAAVESFHARHVKRLLPLVAVAGTLGAVLASIVARLLAVAIGTGPLLFLAGGLCAVAAVLPGRLAARALPAEPTTTPVTRGVLAELAAGVRDFSEVPIARIFLTSAFFATATMILVDFGFKAALKERYGRDEMAAFLGSFGVLEGVLVVAAQLFLTGRFFTRFGIRTALASRPAALLALSPLVAFSAVGAATAVKLGERVLGLGVAGPVSDLLLLPPPAEMRARLVLFARSAAQPLGVVAAGLVLIPFGSIGPSRPFLAFMLAVAAATSVASLVRSRAAYTGALAEGLGQGKVSLDASPEAADLVRAELVSVLAVAVEAGDARRAARVLALMSDRLFALADLAPALAAGGAIGKAAMQVAASLARPGEGPALLAMVPPSEDFEVEREVLALARTLGAPAERARLERAYARCKDGVDAVAAGLWAEAITGLARFEPDAAMRDLHGAAQGPDGPRRAAAIRALGELGPRR